MIPSNTQFERAKYLCVQLADSGHNVSLKTKGTFDEQYPVITLELNGKMYRLADPDWDTVNKQLARLASAYAIS